jgi:hypothetical protein
MDNESILARLADPRARAAVIAALDAMECGNELSVDAKKSQRRTVSGGAPIRAQFAEDQDLIMSSVEPPTLVELLTARDDELRFEGYEADGLPDDEPALDEESRTAEEARELYKLIRRDAAASHIQQAWRMKVLGHDAARIVQALRIDEGAALERPRKEVAAAVAREMLPHREDGQLYSMSEGLAAFDGFGVEVSCYVRFITYTGRVFWVALLLNFSNIISNLGGGRVDDLLAAHSLNNAECLSTSYGVVEALTSAIFVGFAFWLREQITAHARRIRDEEEACEVLTAANFTVVATRCPPTLSTREAQARFREAFSRCAPPPDAPRPPPASRCAESVRVCDLCGCA